MPRPWSGKLHRPTLTDTGSRSDLAEARSQLPQAVAQALDGGRKVVHARGRGDAEELVGAVAADDRGGGELLAQDRGHLAEHGVTGRMAVRLVEQAQVVDVNQRERQAALLRGRLVQLAGQLLHHGAVVEHAGQRVAARGLHELARLAPEARVRGTKDEVEEDRQHAGRGQREQQHLVARGRGLRHDRRGVAVDLEDGADLAADLDRQVLLEEHRDAKLHQVGFCGGVVLQVAVRVALERRRQVGVDVDLGADEVRLVGQLDGAVREVHLEPHDAAVGERADHGLQLIPPSGRQCAQDLVGMHVRVNERGHERAVRGNRRTDRRRGDAATDNGRQGSRSDGRQREADQVDERQNVRRAPRRQSDGGYEPQVCAGPGPTREKHRHGTAAQRL